MTHLLGITTVITVLAASNIPAYTADSHLLQTITCEIQAPRNQSGGKYAKVLDNPDVRKYLEENKKNIAKTLSFSLDGTPAIMIFESSQHNVIETIRLLTNDFKGTIETDDGDVVRINPPHISKLIYHDIGKEKEYCGVLTNSIKYDGWDDWSMVSREKRIPDDVANAIIAIMAEDEFKNKTGIEWVETKKTDNLQFLTVVPIYYDGSDFRF